VDNVTPDHERAVLRLLEREWTGETCPLDVGPYALFLIISMIQLAWRHPALADSTQMRVRELGEQLSQSLAFDEDQRNLLALGWQRSHDIDRQTGRRRHGE